MGSCMVGIVSTRLYMTCALTVPDCSDPGKYPEESGRFGVGIFRGPKVFASAKVRVII